MLKWNTLSVIPYGALVACHKQTILRQRTINVINYQSIFGFKYLLVYARVRHTMN
jgi:hypothetical protein